MCPRNQGRTLVVVRQEAVHVEGALLGQHEINGPAEFRGQDRKCLRFAVPAGQATKLLLTLWIAAKEEHSGFGEGPLQVNVSDLRASGPELLARRAVIAFHEPAVGEKILNPGESVEGTSQNLLN